MEIPEPLPSAVHLAEPEVTAIIEVVEFLGVLDMPEDDQDRVGELIVRLRQLDGRRTGIGRA